MSVCTGEHTWAHSGVVAGPILSQGAGTQCAISRCHAVTCPTLPALTTAYRTGTPLRPLVLTCICNTEGEASSFSFLFVISYDHLVGNLGVFLAM